MNNVNYIAWETVQYGQSRSYGDSHYKFKGQSNLSEERTLEFCKRILYNGEFKPDHPLKPKITKWEFHKDGFVYEVTQLYTG